MDWWIDFHHVSSPSPRPSLHLQKPGMPPDHTLWQWIFYFHWASGGCLSQDNHTVPLWEAQNVFGRRNQDALFRLRRQRRGDCKCGFLVTTWPHLLRYATHLLGLGSARLPLRCCDTSSWQLMAVTAVPCCSWSWREQAWIQWCQTGLIISSSFLWFHFSLEIGINIWG